MLLDSRCQSALSLLSAEIEIERERERKRERALSSCVTELLNGINGLVLIGVVQ